MSFSATILFSPPSGSEARCCCCACKSETSQGSSGSQGGNPPAGTPITVTGHGLAVQNSEQLLHIIYQRVDKAVGLAEAALGLARANNELLKQLQEEVGALRQGKVCTADEDGESRARSPPPEEPGLLKGSPGEACKTLSAVEEECDSVGSGVQVVIEELRQLGAASTVGQGPLGFFAAPQRDLRLPGCALAAVEGAPLLNPMADDYAASEGTIQRVLVPAYATQLAIQRASSETGPENATKLPAAHPEDMLGSAAAAAAAAALDNALEESGPGGTGELSRSMGFMGSPCRIRATGQKNSRRKRDLVLSVRHRLSQSPLLITRTEAVQCRQEDKFMKAVFKYLVWLYKQNRIGVLKIKLLLRQSLTPAVLELCVNKKLVHNVHNHITNDKRFNGSESIKSSWNISVVKFLLEKLKQELMTSPHNYTDKELKGACVAYFLTKRREYRNSLNPFKGLKEKEEKKLRSRRYRLFANRSSIMRHFGPEDQQLWKGVTEELMSDEEDSLNEPGVWVARSPRFRSQRLTELCYHLDANSKHGTKANRVYGPPSDRLPSVEAQLLPPELYNPNFQEEEGGGGGGNEKGPVSPSFDQPHKASCPDLNSFIEIKVEKDEYNL